VSVWWIHDLALRAGNYRLHLLKKASANHLQMPEIPMGYIFSIKKARLRETSF